MKEPTKFGALVIIDDGRVFTRNSKPDANAIFPWLGRNDYGTIDTLSWNYIQNYNPRVLFVGLVTEPKLTCAVVRDSKGRLLVRTDAPNKPWRQHNEENRAITPLWFNWDQIDDPEIMFDGVSDD